jgi:hypothetical protein
MQNYARKLFVGNVREIPSHYTKALLSRATWEASFPRIEVSTRFNRYHTSPGAEQVIRETPVPSSYLEHVVVRCQITQDSQPVITNSLWAKNSVNEVRKLRDLVYLSKSMWNGRKPNLICPLTVHLEMQLSHLVSEEPRRYFVHPPRYGI